MTAEKKPIDWERIEVQYRTGSMSLREIAITHGITHGAINKRAKRDGWTRDLAAKVKAKTESLVSKALVSGSVSSTRHVTEQQEIDALATTRAEVKLSHHGSIRRGRALADALFAELEHQTANPDIYAQLLQAVSEDEDGQGKQVLRQAFHKAMAVGSRISGFARLTEGLKNVIGLERQAWSMDEPDKKEDDLRDLTDDELSARAMEAYANALAARGQD